MSENLPQLRLDPWVASSLLQKSIRRGETELAQYAAKLLHQYRGAAVWSRLITIAAEDIGIADLDLLLEVTRLGTHNALRSVLASDAELIQDVVAKLAASPKDRSADNLHSAANWKISTGLKRQVVEIGPENPLVAEAAHFLQCTTTSGARLLIDQAAVRELLKDRDHSRSAIMEELVERFALSRAHPFTLMLLPLWSAFTTTNEEPHVSPQSVPETEWVKGVPLFVFDKHTAVGKNAIAKFARENPEMRRVLSLWVAPQDRVGVALIAAFYADAMPVARKLDWEHGQALENLGCQADMVMAGCPTEGISDVLKCALENLDDLHAIRRRMLVS